MNDETNSKAHYYSHLELKDIYNIFRNEEEEEFSGDGLLDNIQLTGIVSLRVVPPSRPLKDSITNGIDRDRLECLFLIALLVSMLPNLRDIDFSNNNLEGDFWSEWLNPGFGFTHMDSIESVRWDNNQGDAKASLTGALLQFCDNLTQIIMDDSIFEMEEYLFDDNGEEISVSYEMLEEEVDLNNVFIFHHCCENLQRVSIQNARYTFFVDTIVNCVTQKALIKFVRHAPSLKWFRSDLSQENVNMLQTERPNIEFVIAANRLSIVDPVYVYPDETGTDDPEYKRSY